MESVTPACLGSSMAQVSKVKRRPERNSLSPASVSRFCEVCRPEHEQRCPCVIACHKIDEVSQWMSYLKIQRERLGGSLGSRIASRSKRAQNPPVRLGIEHLTFVKYIVSYMISFRVFTLQCYFTGGKFAPQRGQNPSLQARTHLQMCANDSSFRIAPPTHHHQVEHAPYATILRADQGTSS